jgi:histidinol dehydrogenase
MLMEGIEGSLIARLEQLPQPRRGWAASSLSHFGGVILVEDLLEAAEVANTYAPEHMIVDVEDARALLPLLRNAGEILIGPFSPISAANYAIGVPAALPTGSYAKVNSGLTARSFMKSTSIAQLSEEGLRSMAGAVSTLAAHEEFPAHAASLDARFSSERNGAA